MSLLPVLGVLDVIARTQDSYMRDPSKVMHTRWCLVHAMANVCVGVLAFPGLCRTISLAPDALDPVNGRLVSFAIGLHIYHAVFYTLSSDDRFHHILFALGLGLPSWMFATDAVHAMLWFLSGVPGAIIYTVIFLRRRGAVEWNEPVISACVNVGLRAPGVVVCLIQFMRLVLRDAARRIPWWVVMMQISLPTLNAVYYTHQSIRRCASR